MVECKVLTHPLVAEFAQTHRFPGWFIDITGCYCCVLGRYLITIFVNSFDEALEITVDTIGESGFYDKNLEWETPEDYEQLTETARRFAKQYEQ